MKHSHSHRHRVGHPHAFGYDVDARHDHEHDHSGSLTQRNTESDPYHRPHRHTPEQEADLRRQAAR